MRDMSFESSRSAGIATVMTADSTIIRFGMNPSTFFPLSTGLPLDWSVSEGRFNSVIRDLRRSRGVEPERATIVMIVRPEPGVSVLKDDFLSRLDLTGNRREPIGRPHWDFCHILEAAWHEVLLIDSQLVVELTIGPVDVALKLQ